MIGIPAKNEAKTIAEIVKKSLPFGDVVVLNDGSTDETRNLAIEAGAQVLGNGDNRGYGFALRNLFDYARKQHYDILITLDGDGQHDPEEIPEILHSLEYTDIAIGNRYLGKSNVPFFRDAVIKILGKITDLGDPQCGFRAYTKKAIEVIKITEDGFGASLEIIRRASTNKLSISEVPVTISYENTTHSQHPFSHGTTLLETLFWGTIWNKPFTTLGIPALIFFISAIFFGSGTIYFYARSQDFVISYALLTIGSLIMWMMFTICAFFIKVNRRMLKEIQA